MRAVAAADLPLGPADIRPAAQEIGRQSRREGLRNPGEWRRGLEFIRQTHAAPVPRGPRGGEGPRKRDFSKKGIRDSALASSPRALARSSSLTNPARARASVISTFSRLILNLLPGNFQAKLKPTKLDIVPSDLSLKGDQRVAQGIFRGGQVGFGGLDLPAHSPEDIDLPGGIETARNKLFCRLEAPASIPDTAPLREACPEVPTLCCELARNFP